MSATPWPVWSPATQPLDGQPDDAAQAHPRALPELHLVHPDDAPAHEHVWQLRSVEYDDALEVRRYECEACDDVLFR